MRGYAVSWSICLASWRPRGGHGELAVGGLVAVCKMSRTRHYRDFDCMAEVHGFGTPDLCADGGVSKVRDFWVEDATAPICRERGKPYCRGAWALERYRDAEGLGAARAAIKRTTTQTELAASLNFFEVAISEELLTGHPCSKLINVCWECWS